MKKTLFSIFSLVLVGSVAIAATMPVKIASKNIQQAVKTFTPLAQSGVREFQVKPAKTVKEMLFALAMKELDVSNESEFSWKGLSHEAWTADEGNWGETTMASAYEYILTADDDYKKLLNEPGHEKEKAQFEKNIQNSKEAFKLLLHTGVMFGVVPKGAVQCGVTFAALAIIDAHTGKIYVFSKEGSGC